MVPTCSVYSIMARCRNASKGTAKSTPTCPRAQQVNRTGEAPFRLQKSSKETALPCKVHRSRAKRPALQCTHLSEASKVKPCPGHCCTLHLPPLLLPEWPRGQGPEAATSRTRWSPATHVELANVMLEPCGVVGSSIQRRFGDSMGGHMAAEQGSLSDPQSLAAVFFTVSDFASNFEIVTCITCASVRDTIWLVDWLAGWLCHTK